MPRLALTIADKDIPTPFNEVRLIHARADTVEKMTFEEFQKSWRQMRSNNDNPALRYFNRQNGEFKFCVLTLVNREYPSTFKQDDIGKPFEFFEEERRRLIIKAMNKMARWGRILPRQFSESDGFLAE
ncbi:hypothetical protein N5923_09920 [Erwiniaceae bacterium BAC15a-03b]|uniref:Uncharacterized protein n=2 Tax=Winslowiella arboricola TaxID=2978220 RepID=A0A9J6PHK8_9GAMM|nr:hypothetical protein [Winslowiella arboricola]MCU5777809.1 hypothetical protein [Winslowiella arboricola]